MSVCKKALSEGDFCILVPVLVLPSFITETIVRRQSDIIIHIIILNTVNYKQ